MRKVKNWSELLGIVGIFVGLALVIAQLRQNEELIRFQIAAEIRVNQDNNRNAIKGEHFAETLAKLQSAPESLTDAELLQFQAHVRSLVSELDFRRTLANVGIFKGDWTTWLQPETCDLMNNPLGRAWLQAQKPVQDPMIDYEMVDELSRRLTECATQPTFLEFLQREEVQ